MSRAKEMFEKEQVKRKMLTSSISDDSHNIWLNLAKEINKKTGMDIWINDLGYMEIYQDNEDLFYQLFICWEGEYGKLVMTKNGKKTHSMEIDINTNLVSEFNFTWFD
jgi:hypothetical protein